jgi:hypothetical protein
MISNFARLEFELFTRPSKSDFLQDLHFFVNIKNISQNKKSPVKPGNGHGLTSVHPEMIHFGFQQGPSEFSTAGIARYFED